MTSDTILAEFTVPYTREPLPGLTMGGSELNTRAIADEVLRLRKIVAALEHPTDAVLVAALTSFVVNQPVRAILLAAVNAAKVEAEVQREAQ